MNKFTFKILVFFLLWQIAPSELFAQGAPACPAVNAGADVTICTGQSTTLTASLVTNNQTTSYSVAAIPNVPYPYVGGTAISVGTDDVWSPQLTLPFNFCYFGVSYNKCYIGSNGVLTFKTGITAGSSTGYVIGTPIPTTANSAMPGNSIAALFRDIDPSQGSPKGTLKYYITGSAPCRALVVYWDNMYMFSCGTPRSSFQLVLYENTNFIDVYVQNSTACTGWNNGGAGIIGIQNAAATVAVVPPNRNYVGCTGTFCTPPNQWSTTGEAWRFSPTGAPSYTYKWYATAAPGVTLGTGLTLNVSPTTTTSYTGEMVLTNCDGTTVTRTDDVIVTVNPLPTSTFVDPPDQCLTGNSFTFTNTGSSGAGYTHSWTFVGGTPSISTAASPSGITYASAGTYTVTHTVTDTAGGCVSPVTSITVVVFPSPTALATTTTNTTCGASNGCVNIGAVTGGTSPYTYSFNGSGYTAATSYCALAAGTYTIIVKDTNGCTFTTSATVVNTPGPTALATTTTNSNCGNADGCVNLGAVTGGVAPYTYSFAGSAFTATTSYCSLAAGSYTIIVKDANGCTYTTSATVINNPGPTAIASTTVNSHCGNADGCVNLGAVTGGTAAYTYSFAGSAFTATTSYCALIAGSYTIIVKDANGCTFTTSATVTNIPGPTAVATTIVNSSCGTANGSVTIGAVTGGVAPYTYSFAGSGFTSTLVYPNLAAGPYTIIVKDANGCTYTTSANVVDNAGVTAIATTVVDATCGAANGCITLGAVTGGTAPYTYSFAGSGFTTSTSYCGLAAGSYTVGVKDANGCTYTTSVTVIDKPGPTAIATTIVNTNCGGSNGCVNLGAVTGGTAPYTYNFNGTGFSATTSYCALVAGSYPIIVKDANGCLYNTSATIIDNPGPTAIATVIVNSSCGASNGCVNLGAVTGGTAPYTYSFNGSGFTATTSYCAIAAGSYAIIVKDVNGCTFNTSATVIDNPGPTAVATTITNSNCGAADGCVTITGVTGGTAPYTYSFNGSGFTGTTNYCGLLAGSYTIKVKDANGCIYTTSVTVIDNLGPTAVVVTIVNSSCGAADGSVTLGAVTGGTAPYTFAFGTPTPFTPQTSYTGLIASTYTIIVKDANGCTFTTTATIVDNLGPTAVATTIVNSNCGSANGSITIGAVTGGVAPYLFSFNSPSAYSPATSYTGLLAGPYTIYVKDANGCIYSTTVTVIDNPGPTTIATTITNSSCGSANGCVVLGAVTGGTAPYTYDFNGSGYTATTNYCGLLAGSYTITVKDANGCIYTTSVTVTDNPGPTAIASTVVDAACGASNGSITLGAVTGGVAPYTYSINGSPYTGTTSYPGLSAAGYTINVKDANGCIFTTVISVSNIGGPTAIIVTHTDETCSAANGTVTLGAVTGGVAPYTYSFNGGAYSAVTNYSNLPAGPYSIDVKDASGCIFSTSVVIINSAGPTAIATGIVNETCGTGNGCVTLGAVTGGTSPYTYSFGGGAFSATTNYCSLAAGTYTIDVKDANGCLYSTSVTLTNLPGPTAVATTIVDETCGNSNGSVNFGTITGGTAPYTIDFNSSGPSAVVTYTGLSAGIYPTIIKDANGCIFNISITILNNPGPTAIATTIVNESCGASDGSVTLGAVTGGTAPYTYSFGTPASPFTAVTSYTGLIAGVYPIHVKDTNGCIYDTSVTITNSGGATAVATTLVNETCSSSNGCVTLGAVTGGTAPYTYSFNGSAYTATTNYCSLVAGTYTIDVKDVNGCIYHTTVTLTNAPGPTALATTSVNETCSNSNGSITLGAVTGGTAPYTYNFNGAGYSPTTVYNTLPAGCYTINVKDTNGCIFTTSVCITNAPGPTAIATTIVNESCTSANGCVTLGAVTGGTAPYTYNFNGGGYVATTNYCGLTAGSYTIDVKDANGCIYSTSVNITDTPGPSAIAVTTVNAACGVSDGSVTFGAVTGGVAPYLYNFNSGGFLATTTYSGLAAGPYTLIVKDSNGCTYTTSVSISNAGGPTAVATTVVNETCTSGNGSISIGAVTGGTAPYTYNGGSGYTASTFYGGLSAGPHTINVKDANGCIFSTSIIITDAPGPTAIATTVVDSTCGNANGSITVNGVTSGTAPYTYNIDGGAFTAATNYPNLPAGPHTIVVKDANGCTFTQSYTLTTTVAPTVAISYPGSPFCNLTVAVQPVTITGTGTYTGGTYSATPTGLIYDTATGGITPFGSTPGTYNVIYTIPATGGCPVITANTSVTISPALSPVISCGTPTTTSVQFNWTMVAGATGYDVSYQVNGGASSAVVSVGAGVLTYTVSPLNAGDSVKITVTPTGGAGTCFTFSSFTCTANSCVVPTATISYASPFCISNSTPQAVTITGTGPYAGGTYSASTISVDPVTGAITPSTATAPGAHTITYITPPVSGCSQVTVTTTVTINALPGATATPPLSTICSGATTNIALTSNMAGATFTWTVAQSNVIGASNGSGSSIAQTLTATGTAGTVCTATYTITPMANGCSGNPIIATVTVNPAPDVIATPPNQTVCSGQTTGIVLTSTTPGTTFTWTATSGTPATATGFSNGSGNVISQVITALGTGLGTVTYTVTPTANGCTGAPYDVIAIATPPPTATATPNGDTVCSGSAPNIVLTSNLPGTVFNWNVIQTNVTGATAGSGNVISQALTIVPGNNNPGQAVYAITPVTNGCPGATIQVAINVNPIPVVTPNPVAPAPICSGDTTNISLSSNLPGTTFSWTAVTSGLVFGASSGTGDVIAQTLTVQGSSPGSVDYTITPIVGTCSGTPKTVTVVVNPTPEVFGNSNVVICSGFSPNITLTPSIPGTTFTWTVSASPNITGALPGSGVGVTIINQNLVNTGTVNETVIYSVTPTAGNCVGLVSDFTVIVEPLITPMIKDGIICVDQASGANLSTYRLDTGLTTANYDFVWYYNGSTMPISGASNGYYDAAAAGTYSVQVTSKATGCVSAKVSAIVTPSYPATDMNLVSSGYFSNNPTITVQPLPLGVEANVTLLYSLDDGPTQESPIFSPVSPGIHTIVMTDVNGCTDQTKTILVVGYPHFFTPNGDGINDSWNIIGLDDQPNAKIYIFDRYGKLIKQISPTGDGWDGTYNGEQLPSTDYWFTVDYIELGGSKLFKAHFSLKR